MQTVIDLFLRVPPITRTSLLLSVALSVAVSLELVSPLKLYFNWSLIYQKHQYWRLLTSIFYRGELSPHTIFDYYICLRYSCQLESQDFRSKPADFIVFFLFGSLSFLFFGYYLGLQFLSTCESAMFLYYWARKNPNYLVNFFDVFVFRSCFMPYFIILLTFLLGYDTRMNLIGTFTGHLYYYLEDIVPNLRETQDFRVLKPPQLLKEFCDFLGIHDWNRMQNREGWFANDAGFI